MSDKSRYEIFKESAQEDIEAYRKRLTGDGTFQYCAQVDQLERLSINLSSSIMAYMFGEQLGGHLWEKFATQCSRNLLFFLRQLTSEYRFFILHELKNNDRLFNH